MGYALPTDTDYVTSDWADHAYRSPPSSEPGTDYGSGYGWTVYAPGAGVVVDVNPWPDGGGGRYVAIDLDDGNRTRTLHMSETWAWVGQRVGRGNPIGLSGASGYGDDWYYGPHAHQTLWDFHGYSFCSTCTIDFAPYVGGDTPAPPEEDMSPEEHDWLMNVYNAFFYGGPSMNDGGRALQQSIADLMSGNRPAVLRNGEPIAWLQELADAKTNTITLVQGPTDAQIQQLADAIVEGIANALNNGAAR